MTEKAQKRRRLAKRFRVWARRVNLGRKLAWGLSALAVLFGLATFATWTGEGSAVGPDPKTVVLLLYVDVVVLLLLGAVVARRLVAMWSARRRGRAGSGLHIRIVMLFSLVAVIPGILVSIFAALFLNYGVQAWFSERVSTAISESREVANSYLHEHKQNIRADAFAVAFDLDREAPQLMTNPALFNEVVDAQAAIRSLTEALVVDGHGKVLAKSKFTLALEFSLVPRSAIEKASAGEIAVLTDESGNRVRAVVKLGRFVDSYLVVGRLIEAGVLEHIERTTTASDEYKQLEKRRKGIQITFVGIFVVVALLLLFAAVWLGMMLAGQIARPISELISAADRVRRGDLEVRVDATATSDEIGTLSRAFNRMTSQLEAQRQGLMEANRELDERRRFTETVLAGVSAGVIGLDAQGNVHLPNRSGAELLATDLESMIGRPLGDSVPEMAAQLAAVIDRPERVHHAEVVVERAGRSRTLVVNMAAERLGGDVIGYVVTFDDVTELLSAQRTAAWADVARRIAHEIKNPLTPIQLSAERLKRKYLKEIQSDPDTFVTCTETIVRQVEDIGRMVDEFSSFARMPQATLKNENLSDVCRQAVFLERNRHPEIRYDMDLPKEAVRLPCDSRQITQALTNLLKNAAESITGRIGDGLEPGAIRLEVEDGESDGGRVVTVRVEDNGRGLPRDNRDRLTEPYVTGREKGTGLGLAIVKKIMEDHGGDLVLEDRLEGGARVKLVFRLVRADSQDEAKEGKAGVMDVATVLPLLR